MDLTALGQTGFDLVIMDYSADGSLEKEFLQEHIAALKHGTGGEKTVIAYLSVGEAEDYRFYWQKEWKPENPAWIESTNPEWPGNYKVRFWDPAWHEIVFDYVDWILRAGFDGAYLDVVDAYEYFQEKGRPTATREMIALIDSIRSHAKSFDSDFLIFVQNASELAKSVPEYLNIVDGIGQEDLYYGYDHDGETRPADKSTGIFFM